METVKPLKCCCLSTLKTVLLAEMHSMQSLHEESIYANNLMTVFTSSFYQAICAWHYILLVKEPKSCFYLCFEVFTIENGFAFGNNDKGLGFSKM